MKRSTNTSTASSNNRFCATWLALIWAALSVLGTGTPASALNCNSLYSLEMGGGVACADVALDDLYANPTVGSQGNGSLLGLFAPQCEDGSNLCPGEEVRCMDGTRPMYYVDPAEDINGDPMVSNGWVFFVTGGGSCQSPLSCAQNYATTERSEMTSASATRFRSEGGIFSNTPNQTNLFRHYNRVYMRKCTYDRFAGNRTHTQVLVNAVDRVDLFVHGRRMWKAVLSDLEGNPLGFVGKEYYTGPCVTPDCDNSCPLAQPCEQLPPLANATEILLIGWSGGGNGMIHQLDDLATALTAIAPAADVRGVIDATFKPSIDVQASFWSDLNPADGSNDYTQLASPNFIDANGDGNVEFGEAIGAAFDAYDGLFFFPGLLPPVPGCGGCGQDYSPAVFTPPAGEIWQALQFQGSAPDGSCELVHGPNAPECSDHIHVLLNHVATPFFLRMGLRDSVSWGPGSRVLGATDMNYFYRSDAFGDRVRMQIKTYLDQFATSSELATGLDPSWAGGLPAPPPWPIAVFAPDSTLHAGTIENGPFFTTCLRPPGGGLGTQVNLHDALFDWITFDTPINAFESGLPSGWIRVPAGGC